MLSIGKHSNALRSTRMFTSRLISSLRLTAVSALLSFTVDQTTTKVDSTMVTVDKTLT